jgi:hypothetical protein
MLTISAAQHYATDAACRQNTKRRRHLVPKGNRGHPSVRSERPIGGRRTGAGIGDD